MPAVNFIIVVVLLFPVATKAKCPKQYCEDVDKPGVPLAVYQYEQMMKHSFQTGNQMLLPTVGQHSSSVRQHEHIDLNLPATSYTSLDEFQRQNIDLNELPPNNDK